MYSKYYANNVALLLHLLLQPLLLACLSRLFMTAWFHPACFNRIIMMKEIRNHNFDYSYDR